MASKKIAVNHYAQAIERKYYKHHIAGVILKAASIAFLATGIGMATTSAAKGWIYSSTVTETNQIEQKYSSKFNQLSQTRVDATTSTSTMQQIVEAVELIQKKYLDDPEEMFSLISQDVSLFSNIRIREVDWFTSNMSDAKSANEVGWGIPRRKNQKPGQKPGKKGYFEVAVVEAEFLNFDGDYRYVLSTVDDLEKAMIESGNYFSVEIDRRPLDIESDNSLVGDVGVGKNKTSQTAELAFRVVREIMPDE